MHFRRRFFEAAGYCKYSKTGYFDFISQYLPIESGGVFLEAGAHDGWTGSNTYSLEKVHGWTGVLAEPVPELYLQCRFNRSRCTIYQCALGEAEFPGANIELFAAGLVSTVAGSALLGKSKDAAKAYYGHDLRESISVPLRTIDSLLMESGVASFDFLALDVEGFEAEALKGINFEERPPRAILVEANFPDMIQQVLGDRYRIVATVGICDRLYILK